MNLILIGLAVVFVAYTINRFIMTAATKQLTDEKKLKIFDVFAKRNNFTTVFILLIILIYFGALQYFPHFIIQITAIYLTVYFAYLIFRFYSNYKKLIQMRMPSNYLKSFITSYSIFIFGVIAMMLCVFFDWKN